MPKNSQIKIISQIGNRVRLWWDLLNSSIDTQFLEAEILDFKEINSVRVNKYAKSIVISHNGDINKIISKIKKITPKKLNNKKYHPSKAQIYTSLVANLISYMTTNNKFNATISILSAKNLLIDGLKDFVKIGLNSHTLEALAVAVSILRRDFSAANGTNLLLSIGEYMEQSTVYKSDELLKELAIIGDSETWVETINENGEKELKKVSIKDVKTGDIVVASNGESIAIDGYVISGIASVNQVSLTGEAEPVKKERGDHVMSGTIVQNGQIKIQAQNVGNDTITSRIKAYIQSSLNEKSQIGLKASKLADKLVPITLGLAIFSYFLNRNMTSVASVLQADYSCALKLATPVAFKTAIARAGRNGIMIKGAKAIEALANADTFVFDKTGTLTKGVLSVSQIYSFSDQINTTELLNLAASAEEHYFHPVAEAIVKAAKQRGFKHIHHDDVEFIVAHGVKTTMKGKELIMGSRHFLCDDEKIDFSPYENKIQKILNNGYALLYVAYDKKLIGVIALRDDLRDNAKECIKSLKQNGVKQIIMLTGDTQAKATQVAKELGIDKFYAQCLPTNKAQIIEELSKKNKKIAFIGDGINDAPSLVRASVGISMSKGADIAKFSADISLLKDDICAVSEAKIIANHTLAKVNTNFKAAVYINSTILILAALNKLSPLKTAFLHNGTTIGLLLNALNNQISRK